MKKITIVLVLAMVAVGAMGQLNMQANDKTIAQSHYVFLKEIAGKYHVDIKDYRSANMVTVELGQSLEQCRLSLQQLQEWYKNHQVGESVLLNQSDGQLTIYKASPTLLLVSKANAETFRATYQSVIKALFVSSGFAIGLVEKSDIIGLLTSTDLAMLNKKIKKATL